MCCSVYCTEMEAKEETARAERQLQILVKYSHPRCTHAFIWRKNKPKAGLSLSFSFSTQIRSPPRRLITKTNPTSVFFFFFQRRRTQTAGYQTEQCTEEGTTAAFEGMLEQTHRDTCVRRPIKASDCGLDVTSLYQTGTQASPVIPGSDKWTQFPFIYLSFVRTTGHHVAVPLHKSLCCYGNHRISTTNQACRASSAKDVNNSGCGISENI